MKRIFILFISVLFIFSGTLTASAEFKHDALFNVSYRYDDGNFLVYANFTDITIKDGIISVEYNIDYDHTALEIVNIEHIIPEKWNSLIEQENVENFSFESDDGIYHWGYAVISVGEGAKKDGELGIVIEFKPLGSEKSDILLSYSDLRGEIVEDGQTTEFVRMSSNSAKIDFDPQTQENTKLFYVDVDANAFIQKNRYYEVENIVNQANNNEMKLVISDTNFYLAMGGIAVCLITFIMAVVYVFTKSK